MDTTVETLGEPTIENPLKAERYFKDSERVLYDRFQEEIDRHIKVGAEPPSFVRAGPRERIYFDPSKLKCAIVTCGGLCPGTNNVIRSLVLTLNRSYGVTNILGIKYGLQGLIPGFGHPIIEITPEQVEQIHQLGGTILATSRGPQDIVEIVDALERMNIQILFMIGGDGTLRAAMKIADEIHRRGCKIGIIGIPKTIDNDINLISRSFGFNTAVDMATRAIASAHVESSGFPNGVGLVKLMGRHSGFIAAWAALAQRDADMVLIPECDFDVDGPHGLLAWLEQRLQRSSHAVIVAAEGAGQRYCPVEGTDKSGNPRLGDIGHYLREKIREYFGEKGIEISIKYIDPSYMIRSVPANAGDAVFCGSLGQMAVHAGIAGKTNVVVGEWKDEFVLIPNRLVAGGARRQVDITSTFWRSVLESTGQPALKALGQCLL